MNRSIALRPLDGEPEQIRALQRVLEAAPRFARLVTGALPGPADAQILCTILPEGKNRDDKFVLAIHDGGTMIGCIDLIRGYPDANTAHLGLLLVAEVHEGRGVGRAAVAAVEDLVRGWGTCSRMRLGVVRINDRAAAFWSGLGFRPTGEVKPYRHGPVVSQVVLYDRPVSSVPR